MLIAKFAKRGVDARFLELADAEKIGGDKVKQKMTVKNGVEIELAKRIVKMLKDAKLKVTASIQGDVVRVSGRQEGRAAGGDRAGAPGREGSAALLPELPRLGRHVAQPPRRRGARRPRRAPAGAGAPPRRCALPPAPRDSRGSPRSSRAPALDPARDHLRGHFHVALQAQVPPADHVGLVRAVLAREDALAPGRNGEGLAVPLEGDELAQLAAEPVARERACPRRARDPSRSPSPGWPRRAPPRARASICPPRQWPITGTPRRDRVAHEREHRPGPRQLVVGAHRPAHEGEPREGLARGRDGLARRRAATSVQATRCASRNVAKWPGPSVREQRKIATGFTVPIDEDSRTSPRGGRPGRRRARHRRERDRPVSRQGRGGDQPPGAAHHLRRASPRPRA